MVLSRGNFSSTSAFSFPTLTATTWMATQDKFGLTAEKEKQKVVSTQRVLYRPTFRFSSRSRPSSLLMVA
jgi:hypothetical protein